MLGYGLSTKIELFCIDAGPSDDFEALIVQEFEFTLLLGVFCCQFKRGLACRLFSDLIMLFEVVFVVVADLGEDSIVDTGAYPRTFVFCGGI